MAAVTAKSFGGVARAGHVLARARARAHTELSEVTAMGGHHTPMTDHEHLEELSGEVRDELLGEGSTIPDVQDQLDELLEQQNFNALEGLDSPDSQASAEFLQNHHAHEALE